jgi:hypothetical protein
VKTPPRAPPCAPRAGASSARCARAAHEELCRAYWYPLHAFLRVGHPGGGRGPHPPRAPAHRRRRGHRVLRPGERRHRRLREAQGARDGRAPLRAHEARPRPVARPLGRAPGGPRPAERSARRGARPGGHPHRAERNGLHHVAHRARTSARGRALERSTPPASALGRSGGGLHIDLETELLKPTDEALGDLVLVTAKPTSVPSPGTTQLAVFDPTVSSLALRRRAAGRSVMGNR